MNPGNQIPLVSIGFLPSKARFARFVACAGLATVGLSTANAATEAATSKQEKTVTVISADAKIDGSSQISREIVKDCISALPDPATLEPEITSENLYLHEINGETGKNEWTRVYTAKLEVNYLQTKKEMLVVTTRSVQAQAPVFKEIDKSLRQSQSFISDPAGGDMFAGRSKRQYYYTKAEGAAKDVRQRAQSWVQQHKSVICPVP